MDSFYSSDEEVAWGPITLREIKGDLKRPVLRIPSRRHTSHCEQTTEINKMSNVVSEDTILEISAYLTTSKAASVQNDTQFYSSEENSIKHNHSTTELNRSVRKNFQELPLNHEIKDTSHINFVQNAMVTPCDMIINNEHLTLVESPKSANNSCVYNDAFDIIELSSDDEANLSCVLEISDDSVPNTSYYSEKDCSKLEKFCEIESCKDDLPLDQSVINESKYPAITIPEVDLQEFNDSSICLLNDTIEKINAILNQADDISFTESPVMEDIKTTNSIEYKKNDREAKINIEDINISPICKQDCKSNISGNDDYIQSCNLISGSFIQKPVSDLPIKKTPTKYHTPIKSQLAIKSHIPVPTRSSDSFKVPTLPAQKTKQNFKDIISPVRMYIKYSPKPVLQRNVNPVETKQFPKSVNSRNKENIDVIPSSIVYKPSKNPVLGSERTISMPTSLNKMVVKSVVTKHERNPVSVSLFSKDINLDSECELTRNSLNDSQLSESDQNMSVLHKIPAFRK